MQNKVLWDKLIESNNDYTLFEQKFYNTTQKSLVFNPDNIPPIIQTKKSLTTNLIIPAHNVKSSILSCLASIEQSSFNILYPGRIQVIVVDDGSNDGTWEIIKNTKFKLNLLAVKQSNMGQAQALNTGISIAEGDIIICCDADMVLSYYTIEHLMVRHQLLDNVLLTGFRTNASASDDRVNFQYIRNFGVHRKQIFNEDDRIKYPVAGFPCNMSISSDHYKLIGNGKSLWMPPSNRWLLPDMVIGALFSLPKKIYYEIGGYDERLMGWGCTDGYLGAKSIGANVLIIPVYSATGLHIEHANRSPNKQIEFDYNRKLFFHFIKNTKINEHPNWLKNAKNRITETHINNQIQVSLKTDNDKSIDYSISDKIENYLLLGKYSEALEINNKNKANDNYLMGKILFGLRKYHEAITELGKALESDQYSKDILLDLSIAYAAVGLFSNAQNIMHLVYKYHPSAPELHYWYYGSIEYQMIQGDNYCNEGFFELALHCYEAALIKTPNNNLLLKKRDKCIVNLN